MSTRLALPALLIVLGGASLFGAGVIATFTGGSAPPATTSSTTSPPLSATPPATPTASSGDATANSSPTPPPAAAETPAPSPTSPPYDGEVARFKIPRFDVDSPVENIGLLPNNQLDVPKDPLNTGWYGIYDKPGFGGNSVFSAHVDYYPDIKGPFYRLFELEPGDEVVVVMDDGREYVYEVFFKERYDVDTIPMGDLIWPADKPEAEEWVTLITCGGRFQRYSADGRGPGYYLDRDVVIARRVS